MPLVFVDKDVKPWSLRPGYDVSAFFPSQELRHGRPTWLSLGNLQKSLFRGWRPLCTLAFVPG